MRVLTIIAIVITLLPGLVNKASAQSSTNYSASNMWGTSPSGIAVPGAVDSSVAHNQLGAIAGEVNAAADGMLINTGGQSSIYAIGSETIVSSSITGSNSSIGDISATQSSLNSGSVSNNGQITH